MRHKFSLFSCIFLALASLPLVACVPKKPLAQVESNAQPSDPNVIARRFPRKIAIEIDYYGNTMLQAGSLSSQITKLIDGSFLRDLVYESADAALHSLFHVVSVKDGEGKTNLQLDFTLTLDEMLNISEADFETGRAVLGNLKIGKNEFVLRNGAFKSGTLPDPNYRETVMSIQTPSEFLKPDGKGFMAAPGFNLIMVSRRGGEVVADRLALFVRYNKTNDKYELMTVGASDLGKHGGAIQSFVAEFSDLEVVKSNVLNHQFDVSRLKPRVSQSRPNFLAKPSAPAFIRELDSAIRKVAVTLAFEGEIVSKFFDLRDAAFKGKLDSLNSNRIEELRKAFRDVYNVKSNVDPVLVKIEKLVSDILAGLP